VLFCKWWYVALPVSFAAKIVWVPVLLHESDMHAWLTNRLVSKVAKICFTGFAWVFPKKKEIVVWQILSGNLLKKMPVEFSGIDNEKTTVIVMWWSQWAWAIFECIEELTIKFSNMQFIVVTWTKNENRRTDLSIEWHSWTTWFVSQEELAYIYELCDISITRWSMTSLAEQHLFWIKKIIVPLPFTGWNHQEYNADRLVSERGDNKVLQNDKLWEWLVESLSQYVDYKKSVSIDSSKLFQAHKTIWNIISAY